MHNAIKMKVVLVANQASNVLKGSLKIACIMKYFIMLDKYVSKNLNVILRTKQAYKVPHSNSYVKV